MDNAQPDPNYPDKISQIRELDVEPGQRPERIDRWLARKMAGSSRNKVQEAIEQGAVLVNDKPTKSNYKVKPGDRIRIELLKPPPIELVPEEIPLDILFEDNHVLVVNKPAGMVTHPGFGNRTGTLVNAVLWHVGSDLLAVTARGSGDDDLDDEDLDDESEYAASNSVQDGRAYNSTAEAGVHPFDYDAVRPGIVHRLDKDTSGVMVVAKTILAKTNLGQQFHDRTIEREYEAVVWGAIESEGGDIEGNIARDPRHRKRFAVATRGGKYALTRYRVIERFDVATLLSLKLATGRTHQIRVHAAHMGHPLIGDATYGGDTPTGIPPSKKPHAKDIAAAIQRHALHARHLGFYHPVTGTFMEFDAPMPDDLLRLLDELRKSS